MFARSAPAVSLFLIFILAVSSGCRRGSKASPTDPEKARATLRQGLDAWKSGQTPESIESSASIIFVDPQWKKGMKLVKYEIVGDGQAYGHDWQCKVKLTVKDDRGEKTANAVYNISTAPKLLVARSDMR